MLQRMPARVFDEWLIFNDSEPIGQGRGDVQAGIVAATIDNNIKNVIYVLTGERMDPTTPADFVPQYGRELEGDDPVVAPEDLYSMMKAALVLRLGGSDD